MTGRLVVVAPGWHSSVQGRGRVGVARWGVPRSGALDEEALRLALGLVGGADDDAGVEVLHGVFVADVADAAMRLAVGGVDAAMCVEAAGGTWAVAPWTAIDVHPGARVHVAAKGGPAYLVVAGGLAVPPVLGSRATAVRVSLGGWRGRTLAAGDALPVNSPSPATRTGPPLALEQAPRFPEGPLAVVVGPHLQHVTDDAVARLTGEAWTVSADADRMGLRLSGPGLARADGVVQLAPAGVVPGALQVPPSGQPILLLADCQTTGGYPVVAAVARVELPRAGRLRPGDRVRFEAISVGEAHARLRAREAELAAIASSTTRATQPAPGAAALWAENLVGGVVDASAFV